MGKDAALEVFGKSLARTGLGAVVGVLPVELARAGQFKPSLVVLGHGLAQQRALEAARVVELGF